MHIHTQQTMEHVERPGIYIHGSQTIENLECLTSHTQGERRGGHGEGRRQCPDSSSRYASCCTCFKWRALASSELQDFSCNANAAGRWNVNGQVRQTKVDAALSFDIIDRAPTMTTTRKYKYTSFSYV